MRGRSRGSQVVASGDVLTSGVLLLASVSVMVFALVMSNRGLDLLDESFALSLATQPTAAVPSGDVFLYGFLVHPLFLAVGQDIALYRAVGLLALSAASVWALVELERSFRRPGPRQLLPLFLLAGAAMVSVLPALAIRSPQYRSVAVLGMMVVVAGLARASRQQALTGGLAVGVGAVLTFTGKPTTAAVLAVAVAVFLLVTRTRWPTFAVGLVSGSALMAAGVLATSGLNPVALIEFLVRGSAQVREYESFASVSSMLGLRQDELVGSLQAACVLSLVAFVPAVIVALLLRGRPAIRTRCVVLATLVGAVLAAAVAKVSLVDRGLGEQAQPLTLVIAALAVAVLGSQWSSRLPASPLQAHAHRGFRPMVALLLALPYVAAVGTNTLFVYNISQAAAFWTLALALLLLGHRKMRLGLIVVSAGAVVSVVGLTTWISLADRTPGGSDIEASRVVRVAGGTLKVTEGDALALGVLAETRDRYGLSSSTPSIDLTGFAAGYQYQLGTRPLGRPTYYGIFGGATAAARQGLSHVPCEVRAQAWVLFAEDNPFDVSQALVDTGVDVRRDYVAVASFRPSQGDPRWQRLRVSVMRPDSSVPNRMGCP